MPFSPVIECYAGLKRLLSVRRHPVATYSLALSLVAAATLLRWAIGVFMTEGVPFITYFPAIVLATLIGGLWPGVFATILSAIVAWHLLRLLGLPCPCGPRSISV
jgi:two-component system, sensor histidine kinase PdtaS